MQIHTNFEEDCLQYVKKMRMELQNERNAETQESSKQMA